MKPGGDNTAVSVDDPTDALGVLGRECGVADVNDAVVDDDDIGVYRLSAPTVQHPAALDDQVDRLREFRQEMARRPAGSRPGRGKVAAV